MSSTDRSSRRAQLRAALITLVVLVHGLAALPLPRRISTDYLGREEAKEEIARWVALLDRLGVTMTGDELVSAVNVLGDAASGTRKTLMAPAKGLLRITGTGQAWALFAYPDRLPNYLIVEGRRDRSAWEILHRSLDPRYTFLAEQIRFRRVRGVWDTAATRSKAGRSYERMVDWIAAEAFGSRPDLDTVRVRLQEFRVSFPGETDTFGEKTRHARTRSRPEAAP